MINTLNPAATVGHDDQRGEVLERINKEYGKPPEKDREPVKKLGKDEFFKIMITQIQHQDPLKPYDNEQMAAQLAQFSSLEQMVNMNTNLQKLAEAQKPLHHLGAAGLIGKWVSADSSRFVHTEGKYSDLKFDLPVDAKDVHMLIVDEKGETVREIDYGPMKKGEQKVSWNGKKNNNSDSKSGTYMIQVDAKNERGQSVPVEMTHTAIVNGVAYDGNDTILLTGDIRRPQKILLSQVSRIVDRAQAELLSQQPKVIGAEGIDLSNVVPKKNGEENQEGAAAAEENSDGQQAAAQSAAASGDGDRPVEGYEPGKNPAAFTPLNMKAFQEMNEKPLPEPRTDNQARLEAEERANDLTKANPNAETIAKGLSDKNLAPGQGMPPRNDGGIVGNW